MARNAAGKSTVSRSGTRRSTRATDTRKRAKTGNETTAKTQAGKTSRAAKTRVSGSKAKAPGTTRAASRPSSGAATKRRAGGKATAAAGASKRPAAKTADKAARGDVAASGFSPYRAKPGEKYMNPRQIKHFRSLLLFRRGQLLQEGERTVHHMMNDAGSFADPNDRATHEEEFTLELRARDRERKLIHKIDEAIRGLDEGDYGYCENCGEEIGVKRLEARPMAKLCIECKRLDEIRERQFGE